MQTAKMITIDGSKGEGGGQMLRTSLALSVITGRPFQMVYIRANRQKPGLMRQHLACVKAAAEIGGAEISGADLNSQEITFHPAGGGAIPGEYHFAIGSAGSTSLVIQTVLLPLIMAKGKSTVTVVGGTHNPMAPPYTYLEEVFVPLLRRMGADVKIDMERPGFVPAGGGIVRLVINGTGCLGSLDLLERGDMLELTAVAVRAGGLPGGIVERELKVIANRLPIEPQNLHHRTMEYCDCPGNFVAITVRNQNITEMFTTIGELRKRAESVANECVNEARAYLEAGVPVGPHLADQLLLPMAVGSGGAFSTSKPSPHTLTNVDVIKSFINADISWNPATAESGIITIKKAGE